MKKLFFCFLIIQSLFAAAPTIVDGPVIQGVGATWAQIKWVTSEGAGASSTITSNITFNESIVPVSECSGFPVFSVVRIEREHALVSARSASSGACNLTLVNSVGVGRSTATTPVSFNPRMLRVWEGQLISITANSNICTATTSVPHLYTVNDTFRVWRATGISDTTRTVASTPTSTTFTFSCPGVANGTYNQKSMEIQQVSTSHSNGASITRIDNDAKVCLGTSTGTYTLEFTPNYDSIKASATNHFVYLLALQPETTYYGVAMSTMGASGPSDCDNPGSDTVVSEEFMFTTTEMVWEPELPSTDAKTWNFHVSGLEYDTDVETQSDCSDLQSKINSAAAANGNLNHRIRIPATANCSVGKITLSKKTGINPTGTGRLVLTTSGTCLPEEGERINDTHLECMPRLALNTKSETTVLYVAPESSYWIVRGLQITVDNQFSTMTYELPVVSSFIGDFNEYDITKDPHHIVISQNKISCPEWNNYCRGGVRLHGDYLVIEGNDIRVLGYSSDMGAVQIDGFDTQYVYVNNNRLQAAMSGFFTGDDQLNQRDIWIQRNYMTRPESWNPRNWQHQFKTTQNIELASTGSTTTFNTAQENFLSANTPVAFTVPGSGEWAALNYKIWSVLEKTMNITVSSGTATVNTSSPHGLTTGQRIVVSGGYSEPCHLLNSGYLYLVPSSKVVTVVDSDTFTFSDAGYDFSTVSGDQCRQSDIRVIGPVWNATVNDLDTFTVSFNSTGFGSLPEGSQIHYYFVSNQKNGFELKQGRRVYVGGNIIENPWAQNQSGWGFAISPRGVSYSLQGDPDKCFQCLGGVTDLTIENNVVRNSCTVLNILGANNYGITLPVQRVKFRNNLAYGIGMHATSGETCHRSTAVLMGGHEGVDIDHNTVLTSAYTYYGRMITVGGPPSTYIKIRNNILTALVGPNNGSCEWAGLVEGKGCSTWSWREWDQGRNVYYGDYRQGGSFVDAWRNTRQYMSNTYGDNATYQANYWPESQYQIGWAGHKIVTGCTNTAPIVCTTSTDHDLETGDQVVITGVGGNTNANGHWFVRVVSDTQIELAGTIGNGTFSGDFGGNASLMPFSGKNVSIESFRLTMSSPYITGEEYVAPGGYPEYSGAGSGPSYDNKDVGVDMDELMMYLTSDYTPDPPDPITPTVKVPFYGTIQLQNMIIR